MTDEKKKAYRRVDDDLYKALANDFKSKKIIFESEFAEDLYRWGGPREKWQYDYPSRAYEDAEVLARKLEDEKYAIAREARRLEREKILSVLKNAWQERCGDIEPWPDDDNEEPHDATAQHVFSFMVKVIADLK